MATAAAPKIPWPMSTVAVSTDRVASGYHFIFSVWTTALDLLSTTRGLTSQTQTDDNGSTNLTNSACVHQTVCGRKMENDILALSIWLVAVMMLHI